MINELEIVRWLVVGVMGIAVWFFKTTLTKLAEDVEMIKKEYLHKEDFKEFKMELRAMFEELKKDIRAMNHEKS